MENVRFGSESLLENAPCGSVDSILTFGESLVENSWKTLLLIVWILTFLKVSWKTLVLEVWILIFAESLVENARFDSVNSHFPFDSVDSHFW